jgi:hypothetical protein
MKNKTDGPNRNDKQKGPTKNFAGKIIWKALWELWDVHKEKRSGLGALESTHFS